MVGHGPGLHAYVPVQGDVYVLAGDLVADIARDEQDEHHQGQQNPQQARAQAAPAPFLEPVL